MGRAHSFLAPHFDEIEVLCVLRPQIDLAVSKCSTRSRARAKVLPPYFDALHPGRPFYNYDVLERRWSDAFGAENVTLHSFRDGPSLPVLLCDRLGFDLAEFSPVERSNEAIDVGVMALVNMLDVPVLLKGGRPNPFSALFIDELGCDTRLQVGLELAQQVQARFDDSNRALLRRRPELPAGAVTPDWVTLRQPFQPASPRCGSGHIAKTHRARDSFQPSDCARNNPHPQLSDRARDGPGQLRQRSQTSRSGSHAGTGLR